MKNNFKKEYRDLEMRVHAALRQAILNSKYKSKHISSENVLKVDIGRYSELAIIHDRLTFMDHDGYQYSIFTDCSLEDLIDILNKN